MINFIKMSVRARFSVWKTLFYGLFLWMLSTTLTFASEAEPAQLQQNQTSRLIGTVIDSGGEALPGATIQIKGSTRGVIADMDGNYEFPDCPVGSTLVVSFVGMETIERVYNGEPRIDFEMQHVADELDEVSVVAFARQ